ncbi:dihydrodipicolinate synthase family protein [Pedococcus sp. 2YAF34]|uniref:dihydrodipicolinate synthase family protein n=1 Tax=Pedococcus sp. 2YAF34 TaxID=3233032 RepID=UPI003F9C1C04
MPVSLNPSGRQLIAALPTAFDSEGTLDTGAVRASCELVAASSCDGAFVGGTTGEFLALERDERAALLAAARAGLGGRRLIAHLGAASARQAMAVARDAVELGVTEFALLTPLYLPASPDATVRYFEQVAAVLPAGTRLYAYLFQARTSTEVTAAVLRRITDTVPVVGAKISGETLATCRHYADILGPEFEVFTGSDADYGVVGRAGLVGVVSGVASCLPEPFDALNRALELGDADAIREADAAVQRAVQAVAGDIARIKTVLALRGIGSSVTRQAMDLVPDAVRAELGSVLRDATEASAVRR